jgi:hypothetical protein
MKDFLLNNIFTNNTEINNIKKINMNSKSIFNNKLSKTFNDINSYLLNTNNKPFFLFQTLQLNLQRDNQLYFFSNFKDTWGNIKREDRLTFEYKKIYKRIIQSNKKNYINIKKNQKINSMNKNELRNFRKKLSKYFINGKDALYILSNRLKANNIKTINYILNNFKIKDDIDTYNKLEKLHLEFKKKIYNKDDIIIYYNLSKYLNLFEIISVCDQIIILRKIKKNLSYKKRIFIFKNFNFDEYNIYDYEIILKEFFNNELSFNGHSGMLCLDFANKEFIYFDPDGIDKEYNNFTFKNKISILLKIAYNEQWKINILNYENDYFNNSLQEFYFNFHSNYNYSCTIISSLFGLLCSIFPKLAPKNIYLFLLFKTSTNKNNLEFKLKNNRNIYGGRQLLVWINNLFNLLV